MLYFKILSSELPLSLRIICILKCEFLDKDFREENRQRAQGLHRAENTRETSSPIYVSFRISISIIVFA